MRAALKLSVDSTPLEALLGEYADLLAAVPEDLRKLLCSQFLRLLERGFLDLTERTDPPAAKAGELVLVFRVDHLRGVVAATRDALELEGFLIDHGASPVGPSDSGESKDTAGDAPFSEGA